MVRDWASAPGCLLKANTAPLATVVPKEGSRRPLAPCCSTWNCQFPGCTARHCDAHHIRHWADGGATRLTNLALLCRRHHRTVHEEGFTLTRTPDGTVSIYRPDGRPLPTAPPAPRWRTEGNTADPLAPSTARLTAAGIRIGPRTATPDWFGERLDLHYALDVLRDRPNGGPAGRFGCGTSHAAAGVNEA
ncbi:MAG: HNH endonuclease signature motif containing protein [Vicinamibacteraceae bacterium]